MQDIASAPPTRGNANDDPIIRVGAKPPAPSIPPASSGFTPAWITQALAAGGRFGVVTGVESERIGEGIGLLAELYRLRLTYEAGNAGPTSVIAKLHSSNREVREIAAAYGFYERETRFYSEVAKTIELRTPEHYFSAFDSASGDAVILMEDLAPAVSPDQIAGLSLTELTAAVDSIATLHGRWWNDPRLGALREIMPTIAEPPYSYAVQNYRSSLSVACDALKSLGHENLARLANRLDPLLEQMLQTLATGPLTLNHGDFRTDNLMFRQTKTGRELTVVDWQIVMQVRGPYDLGYLIGGAVPVSLRRAEEMNLLRRYHNRLLDLGVTGYNFADCLLDYRRAVLLGLANWVEGYPLVDQNNARAVALFGNWATRVAAAIDDLDLEGLVP
jgi:hypothetical protein